MCDRRALMGPSVITHNQAGGTRRAHPERNQSLSITVLCFANFVNANFTFRQEKWFKSLTALGKRIPRNFQIALFGPAKGTLLNPEEGWAS
jgi:hypothetical protein